MTSLESLPVEILLKIIRQAIEPGSEAVGVCAAVSRQWQQLLERETFAFLRLDTDRISEAQDILTPARQTYVRYIRMEALLPEYDEPRFRGCRETHEDQQQNNQAFARAIKGLFDCLSLWEPVAKGATQPVITLELCAFSRSDKPGGVATHRNKRWKYSFLSLENGMEDSLPALCMITKFTDRPSHFTVEPNPRRQQFYRRSIEAKVFGIIASRLSNLEQVDWTLEDSENEDLSLRQRMRQEFAASLANFPQSVREFRLFYANPGPHNHDFQPPRAHNGDLAADPFSIALRGVSQHCISFTLDGTVVFDANLFWPQPLSATVDETPYWARLEEFRVTNSMASPSGTWLFHADPSAPRQPAPSPEHLADSPEVLAGDDPEYFYRVHLDHDYFENLCQAAARAAARMPRLKRMVMGWNLGIDCHFGYRTFDGGKSAEYWSESTPALPLTAEAEEAWCTAAKVQIGDDGKMSFDVVDRGEKHPLVYGLLTDSD
ncbi:hypothetical protein G7054_g6866 [Neopestalotiopsis clavispora]|nr:hypothetical protein G7054_g6866 [Neopestalotiopsis clavispora]